MEITVGDLYDFKSCSLRYKYTNVDKVVKTITTNDGIRESMQSVLNYYYFHLAAGEQVTLTALKEKFSSIWNGHIDIYDIYLGNKNDKRRKELEAISMLNNFYRQQQYLPDHVLASNQDFRVPFGDNFFVRGNLPVLRDTARGVELAVFKMGKHKYDEFWQQTDMGLTLMAMAYQSLYKQEIDSIAVHTLRDGQTIYVSRKRSDYPRLIKTVKMVKESIEKGWYYPRETIGCQKCPAKDLCMGWR